MTLSFSSLEKVLKTSHQNRDLDLADLATSQNCSQTELFLSSAYSINVGFMIRFLVPDTKKPRISEHIADKRNFNLSEQNCSIIIMIS